MNSREYREIDKWRTAATKYKKDSDDTLKDWEELKNKDRNYEEQIRELKQEVENYKNELNKQKQPKTTLGEKMALLHHFGIVEFVNGLPLDQTDKYKLLSYIVEAHEKNVSAAFNSPIKNEDSLLNNITNNKFLVKIFQEFNMEQAEKWVQQRLDKLQEKKR